MPTKTLLLGKPHEAAALKQVLEVCINQCAAASSSAPGWLAHSGTFTQKERSVWRGEVSKYDTVIALPSLLRQAPEAMSLVHRLRTGLYWSGRFVAVMQSERQAVALEEASFIGEPVEGTHFGEVPGHDVVTAPLCLSELLILLNKEVSSVSPEFWSFKLVKSGLAAQLNQQIREGECHLNQGRFTESERVSRDTLASVDGIDWNFVPAQGENGHALKNDAQDLLDQYAKKPHLNTQDCSAIIKGAKDLLAQSSFPFPTSK